MKMVKMLILALLGLVTLQGGNAQAGQYRIYCNTLARSQAVTNSWATNQAVSGVMTSLNYSLIRDADFAGSDFNQVFADIQAPIDPEALRIAFVSLCEPQLKSLISGLHNLKVPLTSNVHQCAYAYQGSTLKAQGCKFSGQIQVR